jgi:type IV fimbrial biogenesis protein FimT
MVVLSILVILIGIAAPGFREILLNSRMTGRANDLMADLNVARSEAIKRNVTTFLCTSNDGANCTASAWREGWIVFADANANSVKDGNEPVIKYAAGQTDATDTLTLTGHTLTSGIGYVPYRPSGISIFGNTITAVLCDYRTTAQVGAAAADQKGRQITINQTGRAVVTRRTCASALG